MHPIQPPGVTAARQTSGEEQTSALASPQTTVFNRHEAKRPVLAPTLSELATPLGQKFFGLGTVKSTSLRWG